MEKAPALLRQLGVASATALVISNMVGTGIFTASGFLARDLGEPSLFFGIWIVGALVSLAGALAYSELSINFPSSGGEYVYLTKAYGPVWGFLTGWASLFAGFSAPIAAAALGVAGYLAFFFPSLSADSVLFSAGPEWFEIRVGGAQLLACGLIALLTAINIFGVTLAARFQNVMTSAKLAILGAFVVLGLTMGQGDWSHFSQPAVRESTSPLFSQFAISLCFIYMAYSGWNAATYIAEEIRDPAKNLPRALIFGTLLVGALFLLMNVVFVYAAPLEQMKGVLAVGSLAASKLFGPNVAGLFSALMALSLIPTVNAMVTIGPRIYYAMARDGAFLSMAANVDERFHTPVAAIVLQGVISMAMTLTPFPSLLTFIGLTLNFFAVLAVASLFLFRQREGWKKLPAVEAVWPAAPILFIVVGLWMTVYGFILVPRVSVAAVVLMAIGAVLFHQRSRPGRAQAAYGD
jgi:APA family basic amino acid/polyamine antiporter